MLVAFTMTDLTAAKADDVAIGIFHVEIHRTPRGRRERFEDGCAVSDALPEESFDTIHAGRRVEVLMVAAVPALFRVLWCFFEVKFQSVEMADGVEAVPWFAECEAELFVILDRALEVIDEKLWSERRDAWRSRGCSH